jgi:hypothetical protein
MIPDTTLDGALRLDLVAEPINGEALAVLRGCAIGEVGDPEASAA